MAVRNFTNNNSELRVPIIAGSNLTGDFTLAALVKPNTHADWQAIMAGHTAAPAYQWEFGADPGDRQVMYVTSGNQLRQDSGSGITISTTTIWYIVAFTRLGATSATFHVKPFGSAWTHTDAGGALTAAATTSGGYISFGEAQDVDDLNMRLAVAGVWNSALTNVQVEALSTNLKTADWTGHAVAAVGVWDFNQANAADDVPDLTGNHATITGTISGGTDTNGIAGTAIVTTDDPPGWTFGAAVASKPQIFARRAHTGLIMHSTRRV